MPGSIKLFRLWGIDVFVHWSWLIIAVIQIQRGTHGYDSVLWSAAEYLSLFAIVTMHEFGHALACRSVGGQANRIILWPLGGIAFVSPPPRAGAQLWSIFAGPLVNLILEVPLFLLYLQYRHDTGNLHEFVTSIFIINTGLFIFNMLPIYPLDGGQILRSILWFFIGPQDSLKVASIIGLVGAALGLVLAFFSGDFILVAIALFAGLQSWNGFRASSQPVMSDATAPAIAWHTEFTCPACGQNPPALAIWRCDQCRTMFDTFATGFQCPSCHKAFDVTACPHCKNIIPRHAWIYRPAQATSPVEPPPTATA